MHETACGFLSKAGYDKALYLRQQVAGSLLLLEWPQLLPQQLQARGSNRGVLRPAQMDCLLAEAA